MAPLDVALEYLRGNIWRLLPPYLTAMAPFSGAVLLAIDVVTSEHRANVAGACALLTLTTCWRWGWLAVVQRRVQADLRREPPRPLLPRLATILLLRLYANFALLWGSLIVVPAFYALFISGFATPMVLERPAGMWSQTRQMLRWIHGAAGRLGKACIALAVLWALLAASAFALQLFAVHSVLPSLLGQRTADLAVTVASSSWTMCVFYFLFVLFDLYWTVASVVIFYDLQSRRLGTDLRSRLLELEGAAA